MSPKSSGVLLEGARTAPMPTSVKPMLAMSAEEPFDDPAWLYELKWDGFRAICFIDSGHARLVSRNGIDLGGRFPALKDVPKLVNAKRAILDGELVALDKAGIPRFQLLQPSSMRHGSSAPKEPAAHLVYYAFDLIYLDDRDLTDAPLIDRKELLQSLLVPNESLLFSDHVREKGTALFEAARSRGLEGVMAKRAASRYVGKRSPDWLKLKVIKEADVVIGGYTEPRKTRTHLGALIAGQYNEGKLEFVGHVGVGTNSDSALQDLHERLSGLETGTCPFPNPPKTNEKAHWLRPVLVARVKYSEITDDGRLRHPIFLGFREDKSAQECVMEQSVEPIAEAHNPVEEEKRSVAGSVQAVLQTEGKDVVAHVDGHDVSLTNLDKVFWPQTKTAKRDLLAYYWEVRDYLLPYLQDRPLILKRYPNGVTGQPFYQHNLEKAPEFVRIFPHRESTGEVCYAICDNPAALLYFVNLGAIAFNPWHSKVGDIDHPNWIVFDLDPDETPWQDTCRVALTLRDILETFGLRAYAKTSGVSGMHLYVPIRPDCTYQEGLGFANMIAARAAEQNRETVTLERMIKKRGHHRLYLDCYQNSLGKTIAAPYSVRESPTATVSAPLEWGEVQENVPPGYFTMKIVLERLRAHGDLFEPVLKGGQSLGPALDALGANTPAAKKANGKMEKTS